MLQQGNIALGAKESIFHRHQGDWVQLPTLDSEGHVPAEDKKWGQLDMIKTPRISWTEPSRLDQTWIMILTFTEHLVNTKCHVTDVQDFI